MTNPLGGARQRTVTGAGIRGPRVLAQAHDNPYCRVCIPPSERHPSRGRQEPSGLCPSATALALIARVSYGDVSPRPEGDGQASGRSATGRPGPGHRGRGRRRCNAWNDSRPTALSQTTSSPSRTMPSGRCPAAATRSDHRGPGPAPLACLLSLTIPADHTTP